MPTPSGHHAVVMETVSLNDAEDSNSTRAHSKVVLCTPSASPAATGKASKARIPRHLRSAPLKRLRHATEEGVAGSFILSVIGVMLAIVVGVPLMVFMGLLYPVALLLRAVLATCCWCSKGPRLDCGCCCLGSSSSMLSATDAMWLQSGSSWSTGNGVVHCLLFLERGLDLGRIRDIVLQRVVNAEHENGRRLYPRLTQCVVPVWSGFCWMDDEAFNIDNHVYWSPVHVRTKCELELFLGALIEQPLNPDRPLWEIQVIPYVDKQRDTVLLVRVHHCITDGTSLVKLLTHSLADNQVAPNTKPRFGGTTFPLNAFRALIIGPVTFVSWLLWSRSDRNLFRRKRQRPDATAANAAGVNGGNKVVTWSHDISLSQVNRVKQVTRSALNDVILAALTGSLRTYFRKNGIVNPYDMKINITIDLRYEPKHGKTWVPMGTEFSLVNLPLPTNTEGAIPQLWEVRNRLDDLKTSADPVVMYGAMHMLHAFLPLCLARQLVNCILGRASLLYSNLAGPESPLLIASHRLKSIIFWMPPKDCVPVALSVFTYSDALKLAIIADRDVLPNPAPIITEFENQIDKMSHLLAGRRIPGEHRRRSFILIGREETFQKPPMEELQQKLHDVQDELHAITQRMDTADHDQEDYSSAQHDLAARVAELKDQFSELLTELRRRKSLADGIPISIEDDDEDLDGELRRPRKRALSVSSSRRSSVSMTSTARPLTTPTSSHHSALSSSQGGIELDLTSSPMQEQQRALLDHDQDPEVSRKTCRKSSFTRHLDKFW